jgi:predicted XRE-type DNA-binding protein
VKKKFLKLLDEGWTRGSSNTFAQLALNDAPRLQFRAYLRAAVLARLSALDLTQVEAARRVGVPQPKVSKLLNDPSTAGFSSDKLIDLATKLGLDVEIRVRQSRSNQGKVIVAGSAPKPRALSRRRTA